MQKKLIALALASLAAAPVLAADTSVTLYGLLDAGFAWRGDNYDSSVGSRKSVDSGQFNGSRLGVKGREDLAPGVKAVFQLEAGIAADTGRSNQGGATWGRQSWVGLETNSVKASFGRQYTPAFNLYANLDPFGLGSVAELNNIFTHVVARANNAAYIATPFYNDKFAVEAMYSTQVSGDEAQANVKDVRYASVFPKLKLGNALLEAGYTKQTTKGASGTDSAIDVGAIIDLQPAKFTLAYARVENGASEVLINGDKKKYDRFHIGTTVPFGNLSLLASWNYSKDKNGQNDKASQLGIGATYDLSKRTTLYAAFATIDTTDGANAGKAYQVYDATNDAFGYRRGANIGLFHTF